MMQKIATGFGNMVKNGSSPELVAKVVLNAVRDENPNIRYLAGNDIERNRAPILLLFFESLH